MFKPLFASALLLTLCACGTQVPTGNSNQTPAPSTPSTPNTPETKPDAVLTEEESLLVSDELGDLVANAGWYGPQALRVALDSTSRTQIINGETGTLTMTWLKAVEDDGMTRTRTLVFDDYTGDGKRRGRIVSVKRVISHVSGTLEYKWTLTRPDESPAEITRTIKGTIRATVTINGKTEEIEIVLDEEFKNDPSTGCKTFRGTTMFNKEGKTSDKHIGERRYCKPAPERNG